jgi:hypothetical protein
VGWFRARSQRHGSADHVEGPWAFATDPDDADSIYAIAPKTATHSIGRCLCPRPDHLEYAAPGAVRFRRPPERGSLKSR